MLKLLSILLLLSSFVNADSTSEKVEDFLADKFGDNPRIKTIDVLVTDVVEIPKSKTFKAYMVLVKADLKRGKKIEQRMVWFSDGETITKDLMSLSSGQSMIDLVKPKIKPEFYTKENLLYGDVNATHKVVFFSDPLCPFCRNFVPKAIKEMKKQPHKFAIYYYHFPLNRIHPASATLVKAAVAAELAGRKDVVLDLYKVNVNPREKNVNVILKAFNESMGTKITSEDLKSDAVKKHLANDMKIADYLMVAGTPTVYFDDKIDKTKKKYKKVK